MIRIYVVGKDILMEWTYGLIYTTELSHFRIFHPKILDAYMLASRITYVHAYIELNLCTRTRIKSINQVLSFLFGVRELASFVISSDFRYFKHQQFRTRHVW